MFRQFQYCILQLNLNGNKSIQFKTDFKGFLPKRNISTRNIMHHAQDARLPKSASTYKECHWGSSFNERFAKISCDGVVRFKVFNKHLCSYRFCKFIFNCTLREVSKIEGVPARRVLLKTLTTKIFCFLFHLSLNLSLNSLTSIHDHFEESFKAAIVKLF